MNYQNSLDTYRAMSVSTILIFQRQDDRLIIAVFDIEINSILFSFTANREAIEKIQNLESDGTQYSLPGMSIKELAHANETGEWPKWTGKL